MAEEKESADPVPALEETSESNDASEKDVQKDTGFNWQDYLEVTNSQEVPHTFFQHVEAGLDSELENGMVLEVPLKDDPNRYWLAKVALACGPFSRLRYSGDVEDQSADFWCDLTKSNAHPLGWCAQEGKVLTPPDSVAKLIGDSELHIEVVKKTAKPIPPHLLSGEGFVPAERIKPGMKVEIQDMTNPYSLWIATIIENFGGRLLLRYDTPDSSSPDFCLYFTSPRIYPMGWCAEKGDPWELRRPTQSLSSHGKEEWEAVMEMAKEDARRVPLPPDFFQHTDEIPPHSFMMGMKVEALHPEDHTQIFPATVVEVWGDAYFLVELDCKVVDQQEESKLSWLCTSNHPYIFPAGWANKHGMKVSKPIGWKHDVSDEFHWDEYLQQESAVAAPDKCFPQKPCAKHNGIAANMKLEAVNPRDRTEICVATVIRTTGHIVWIHLESNESDHPNHGVSFDATDIFPVGWCDSNSYPLKPPLYYQVPSSSSNSVLGDESTEKKDPDPGQRMSKLWCPKIYFNHRCFSGPFLSKSKLAGLPQAVGPGPVRLVMREVLSMLISVAYKSSRVLKEIQCDGDLKPGEHVEVLKAKFNQTNYRARVAVVTSSDQVSEFCQDICTRLKVCPYLFGPTRVEAGRCPENCNIQAKSKFTSQYWSNRQKKANRPAGDPLPELEIVGPKRRRGRKRRFSSIKTRNAVSNALLPLGAESDASGDEASIEPSNQLQSVADTPRRREIVTRGAKLALNSSNVPSARQRPERRGVKRQRETELSDEKSPEKVEFPSPGSWLYPLPKIDTNPRDWSVNDVEDYLNQTKDCKSISKLLKREAFDGVAFMLLNLPTAVKQLKLKPLQAVNLCRHVAQIKFIFFTKHVYCDD